MKQADYVITAVRYDYRHERIVQLKIYANNGSTTQSPSVWQRQQVINAIKLKRSFVTAYYKYGQWYEGDDVRVVSNGYGNEYLRTDGNNILADNLGNLPEF
jgi:hypothetical protein